MKTSTKLNAFTRIRGLTKPEALILSCALVQRMLPNYVLFCELMALPYIKSASNLVDLLWEACTNKSLKLNIDAQSLKLDEITPNVDDYDNLGVYAALDFCMSCHAVLQIIADEEPHGAVIVAKLSQGSLERHIAATEGEMLTGPSLSSHPLMSWEIDTLTFLLTMLERGSLSNGDVKQIRGDIISEGLSNLGIETKNSDG